MLTATQRDALDRETKILVLDVREFLERHPAYREDSKLGSTALRNVLDAALAATCVEEVGAFVEYQIGREYQKWMGANGFGTELARVVGGSGPLADRARELAGGGGATERDELALELVRRWLGFLYRHFRYRSQIQKTHPAGAREPLETES